MRARRRFFAVVFAVALAAVSARGSTPENGSPNAANPEAVARAEAGQCEEVNAGWWGFDADDATARLQAAIDCGARKVVVPHMGRDWVLRPVKLRSNLELTFAPGVVVAAKKGEFRGKGDSLFSASNAHDVTLRGYGATLRMWKRDYQNPPYEQAEWRSTLDFSGCSSVRIEGVRLESSGGDGIYLGSTKELACCRDVEIRDVVSTDHHRQGISVISVENLLIENCVFSGTGGVAPEAGIDLEPNSEDERFTNVVVRNCRMEANAGSGILIYPIKLTKKSAPLSVRFENCLIRGGKDAGIGVGGFSDDGPGGLVEFVGCVVEDTRKCGTYIYDKSSRSALVRFTNCTWSHVALEDPGDPFRVPIMLHEHRPGFAESQGGIEFVDCFAHDDAERPAFSVKSEGKISDVTGALFVRNPLGARISLPDNVEATGLRIVSVD
jgi:hypothetical protein